MVANSYAPCTMHLTEVQVRLCRCANCNRFLLFSLHKYINFKTNQIPAVEQTAKTQNGMHTVHSLITVWLSDHMSICVKANGCSNSTAQMHGLNDLSMFYFNHLDQPMAKYAFIHNLKMHFQPGWLWIWTEPSWRCVSGHWRLGRDCAYM